MDFGQKYWVCSVSTCNKKRTGLVFCSVGCWDAHVPMMNHREAWAEERQAPASAAADPDRISENVPKSPISSAFSGGSSGASGAARPAMTMSSGGGARRIVAASSSSVTATNQEILVVVSKVKEFVRSKAEMNTSDRVMDVLSDMVRALCEDAIRRAQEEGRKTIMDRDFRFP